MSNDRWHQYYQALFRAAIALGSSLEPTKVLDELVRGVVDALHAKAASIRLLDPGGDLNVAAVAGLSPTYLQKGPVQLVNSPIDRETMEKGPVQIADARTDPRFQYPEEARREGLVSVLSVPLHAYDRPIGVLRAYTGQPRHFSPEEVDLMVALARLGSLAIANARIYDSCVREHQMTIDALWGFPSPPASETLQKPKAARV